MESGNGANKKDFAFHNAGRRGLGYFPLVCRPYSPSSHWMPTNRGVPSLSSVDGSIGGGNSSQVLFGEDVNGVRRGSESTDDGGNAQRRFRSWLTTIPDHTVSRAYALANSREMPPAPMYATQDSRNNGPGRRGEILQQSNWRRRLPTSPETRDDSSPLESTMGDHDVQDSERVVTPDVETFCRFSSELAASIPPHIKSIAWEVEERKARIVQTNGREAFADFRPSFTALQSFGLLLKFDDGRTTMASSQDGHSRKYLGDPNTAKNRSADIPDEMNCALWVMGLPSNVTHTTLLAAIRDVGKVYSTVINPPTGRHICAAAKIVFFERCQAEKLFDLIYFGNFFIMGRQVLEVRWNKVKSSAYPHWHQSRAIRITGPAHLMDFQYFQVFFKARFTYDLDHTAVVPCSTLGMLSHVWYFGSLRCQAASARLAIERELRGIFEVHWADDPCA